MSEIIARVTRGDIIESVHRGDLAVVDSTGNLVFHLGDPHRFTYWRSAAKPFQLLPLVEAGGVERFGFTAKELAVMTSSHSGEEMHVAAVRGILAKIGLEPTHLSCGSAPPISQAAANKLLRSGGFFSPLTNPCSGKHSAMLALAVLRGYHPEGYTCPDHPVQMEMMAAIATLAGIPSAEITLGTDGCSVPVFGMPLFNMALAYATFSRPEGRVSPARAKALNTIASAMAENPHYAAGTGHLDTVLMEATNGRIISKAGAEGVQCAAVMGKGVGLALKIEDGSHRAADPVVIETLYRLGYLSEEELGLLKDRHEVPVKNHRKEIIGGIRAAF